MRFNQLKNMAPFLGFFLLNSAAFATPAQIVITRHGEKPDTGNEVNQQGCERAYSLPSFFESNSLVNKYGKPVAIYAMKPDETDDGSIRPAETIAPTADMLGLDIQDPFTRLDYDGLVQDIKSNPSYDGKTVLISWEHKALPGLAEAFGAKLTSDETPWPPFVFDEAWVLDFTDSDVTLKIIPENVMPGDNPEGGKNWGKAPTQGGAVASDIADKCVNNDELNSLTYSLTTPALPPLTTAED